MIWLDLRGRHAGISMMKYRGLVAGRRILQEVCELMESKGLPKSHTETCLLAGKDHRHRGRRNYSAASMSRKNEDQERKALKFSHPPCGKGEPFHLQLANRTKQMQGALTSLSPYWQSPSRCEGRWNKPQWWEGGLTQVTANESQNWSQTPTAGLGPQFLPQLM